MLLPRLLYKEMGTSVLLEFSLWYCLLVCADEASCHGGRCSLERLKWQGDLQPMVGEEQTP